MSWDGRELISQTLSNGTTVSYAYNSSGIRTQKTYGTSYRKDYLLDGTTIVAEIKTNLSNNSKETIYYFYDETGVAGFEYNGAKYHYVKNLQGDIISIQNANGIVVVNYAYDAWGNVLSISGTSAVIIGTLNPFRYRGYYYDTETGYYYLNSRYYDPAVGRCINADKVDIISATPTALTDKNLYAYCDNNPIIRVDHGGEFWDTVFDVVSLAFSIAEVCADPSDPWAWAGVVGDAVDLIPFVTGVGEVTRVVKTVNRVVETVDTTYDVAKTVDRVDDVVDTTQNIVKTTKKSNEIYTNGIRYTDKVLKQMENAEDLRHAFPSAVDSFVDINSGRKLKGGDGVVRSIIELPRNINNTPGVFEYIIEPNGLCNHRFFRSVRNLNGH